MLIWRGFGGERIWRGNYRKEGPSTTHCGRPARARCTRSSGMSKAIRLYFDSVTAGRRALAACSPRLGKALADAQEQRVAELAIGGELLLAAAMGRGRVHRGPVFDLGGERARQLQRLVMRLRRQRDDEVEIE